jgi:hypothetical protein
MLVLAPANGLGHQPLSIAANLVLHLFLPALVVALHLRYQQWCVSREAIAASLAFPATYLAWTVFMTASLGVRPPYLFLDSAKVGLSGVLVAVIATAVVYALAAWVLSRIAGHCAR